ncbi:MAG: nucleotide sugar dehydrogenase [Flavobacteriales bacterium]|jgi:UDP-N-acetyl-D-galactosamine dehydrogenase|nr:nucleotide sugar dehydrogenase [Flavobacteriales bacterium]MDG1439138.1 nucleotide sugar dehydrogenase [Flavobacteriales bacterium]MDG1798238.1 nucleotide sugar dehydrogenase [Flavobacteriales bacterium]
MKIYDKLILKEEKLAVVGLGYVGLPIALEFSKKIDVIGFDINPDRVDLMKNNIDPSNELVSSDFDNCSIEFTSNLEDLKDVKFFIIAVPTPIDKNKKPNINPLLSASTTVGEVLKKGDYVVYESTVYPGCTEEDCVPVLEKLSGLKFKTDFKVGYSPERINPGDKVHTLSSIIKVSAGCDKESAEEIAKTYELVVDAGIHRASSIKVAEAAKIIENTQRDVNIALINELSVIFNKMNINTYEVLEAAGTKWNFLNFKPGLVGGHCIGVDPYYLTHKAKELGYHAQIINSGRAVNDSMGSYVGRTVAKKIIASGTPMKNARVLVMGATFKEDVSDIRNSKVVDVINELKSFSCHVEVIDPHANSNELMEEYGFDLVEETSGLYNAAIVAVNHLDYTLLNEKYFKSILSDNGLLVDLKGVFRNKINELEYWTL